jgi:hypothetical protein
MVGELLYIPFSSVDHCNHRKYMSLPRTAALATLESDEDVRREAAQASSSSHATTSDSSSSAVIPSPALKPPYQFVPLRISDGHQPTAQTVALFREAGGRAAVLRMTVFFYESAFRDHVLDKFIRDRTDPHANRFANWISEKLGNDTSWSDERQTREIKQVQLANGVTSRSPHDRSSAHGNAWYSPKREPQKVGVHFQLDDCRVWMRLHFWALKKANIHNTSPGFTEFYTRFIGHFVRVYERKAPAFARDAFRWSDSQANIDAYKETLRMDDVVGLSVSRAVASIPREEANDPTWPYYDDFNEMVSARGNEDGFYTYN